MKKREIKLESKHQEALEKAIEESVEQWDWISGDNIEEIKRELKNKYIKDKIDD